MFVFVGCVERHTSPRRFDDSLRLLLRVEQQRYRAVRHRRTDSLSPGGTEKKGREKGGELGRRPRTRNFGDGRKPGAGQLTRSADLASWGKSENPNHLNPSPFLYRSVSLFVMQFVYFSNLPQVIQTRTLQEHPFSTGSCARTCRRSSPRCSPRRTCRAGPCRCPWCG